MTVQPVDDIRLKNMGGVSSEQRSLLWRDLSRLSNVAADLAEPLMRFIVDGDEDAILDRLRATPGCGKELGLHGCLTFQIKGGDRKARLEFFKQPPCGDSAFYYRLAQAYDAIASADRQANRFIKSTLPKWIDLFLSEVTSDEEMSRGFSYSVKKLQVPFTADLFEAVVVAGSEDPAILVRTAVLCDPKDWSAKHMLTRVTCLTGFADTALRHANVISEGLHHTDAEVRIHTLTMILNQKIDRAPFAERIVELAVSTAKTVRKAAEPSLDAMTEQATLLLQKKAEEGSNDERLLASQLLWRRNGESGRDFLTRRMKEDKSAKVKAMLGELLIEGQAIPKEAEPSVELPLIPQVDPRTPLSADAKLKMAEILKAGWEAANQHAIKHPKYAKAPGVFTPSIVDRVINALEEMQSPEPVIPFNSSNVQEAFASLAGRSDFSLLQVVRLAFILTGGLNEHYENAQLTRFVTKFYFSHKPRPSLRELAANLAVLGRGPNAVSDLVIGHRWAGNAFLNFDPADVWPFFFEHDQLLEDAWHGHANYVFQDDHRRKTIFKILSLFPTLPPRFVRLCWDIAFNGTKKERPLAQAALDKEPGKEDRILTALGGGKAEHRAIAAEWLGKLECKPAIAALKKALAKEKQEAAAGQMMVALERLGVPLEEFVSMDGLLKEAKALIDKGIPEALKWLDFDRLPKVRWAVTGKLVRKEILQWMVIQSYKLGSPQPGPRLRKYTSYFDRAEAEELGQYLLESWIAQDTICPTHDAAHAYAEKHANQIAAHVAARPQSAQYYKGAKEDWYRSAYNQKIAEPIGTANGEKGILAVAGACCGQRAAAPVERFLKTYYGYRVHQCKALIRMLSWIEHPSAIQVLLSVSNRFRTAGIRKEAELCVAELAERKNWTVDELADRTIPTAGLEEGLQLTLDYGQRKFTAKLTSDFDLILSNEEGKVIKGLPAPRQDEDAEKAKSAKKKLSASKKEVDAVLKLQKERLYESMCTQRTWSFADWNQFLNGHAIVRLYCQRLIWAVVDAGKTTQTFRPLDDGTLTDINDDAVEIPLEARVCVAHACNTPAEIAKAWQQHLLDYSVHPLLEQFAAATYQLPEEKRDATSLTDFQGHLLEAFKLRGRLTRLGYTRGTTGDGGFFWQYNKHFSSLGLIATIEFTGNPLPEQNRTIALTKMYFAKNNGENDSPYSDGGNHLQLSEVPAVLLSECWNDYRLASAEGSGFDPDWEKKLEY